MNYKEDILDTFDKLMFFSKPIERETTPEIKEQNKIIREQWIQAIRDYLYEHEQISNSVPLEAFEKLKNKPTLSTDWDKRKTAYDYNKLEYDIIEAALKDYGYLQQRYDNLWHVNELKNKSIKALKIIKEKEVNVYILQWYLKHSSYEQYADDFERNRRDCDLPDLGDKILTQEEYDLLKEVLL